MAAKVAATQRRFLDVWIVESNTVYREVPFTVVSDWIQQGRLLEDDKIKASGTADWSRIGDSPDLTPYLPRPDPTRAEDQAEALESVGLDVGWRRPRGGGDESDPDMIPLIDVSLVLLVFFMMTTTTTVSAGVLIPDPATQTGSIATTPTDLWLGVDLGPDHQTPVFSLGEKNNPPAPEDSDLHSEDELLARLQALLNRTTGKSEVTIHANPAVHSGVVRRLLLGLQKKPFVDRLNQKYYGVQEAQP